MRYAKNMNGSKCYTICGDPLYFAQEIVQQQGYNYGADLWAFGILAYELFESMSPFGNIDTDVTTLFKIISSFKYGDLKFTEKTTGAARDLIVSMLNPTVNDRLGYKGSSAVKSQLFFAG